MDQQLLQEINRVLYSYSLTVPKSESTDWSHILAFGPLNVYARKFDQGSIEVEEKVKGMVIANYVRAISHG
jgi:hypothetical protein